MNDRNKVIEAHYRKNYKNFVKMVSGLLRNRGMSENAEDVVQEAYANSLEYWHPMILNIDTWFRRILWTTSTSYNNGKPFKYFYEVEDSELVPEGDIDWVYFYKYISGKKESHQNILKDFFYFGVPPREISNSRRIKLQTVKNVVVLFRKEVVNNNNFVRV